jgi:acetyl esterase/lipase
LHAKSAIRFLRAHGTQYSLDTSKVAVWGESAGGYLASMVGATNAIAEFERPDKPGVSSDVQAVINQPLTATRDCRLRPASRRRRDIRETRRTAVTRRREILDANPDLQERELRKRAALTEAIAGMVVQQTAMQRWPQSPETRPLQAFLSDALLSLRTIAAQTTAQRGVPAET